MPAALTTISLLAVVGPIRASNESTPRGWPGPNNVKSKKTWSYSGPCSPGTVYYPDSEGKFPLLSFAHGLGASGTRVRLPAHLNPLALNAELTGC